MQPETERNAAIADRRSPAPVPRARPAPALRLVADAAPTDGTPAAGQVAADGSPPPALPDVFGLTPGEQLLLWSARRWRHGRYRWDEVEGEFRRRLGARWADALLPWEMALDLLHRLPLGQPEIRNGCATRLSADEMALLRLPALIQAGREDTGALLLARLAPRHDRAELQDWLALVADAGPRLPLRPLPLHPAPAG